MPVISLLSYRRAAVSRVFAATAACLVFVAAVGCTKRLVGPAGPAAPAFTPLTSPLSAPASQPLAADQFCLVTTSRSASGSNTGGTIEIRLPENRAGALQERIMEGSGKNYSAGGGSIPAPRPQQTQMVTLRIAPETKDGVIQNSCILRIDETPKVQPDPSQPPSGRSSRSSTYVGQEAIVWALNDGVYPMGKPVLIGTAAGKPVTLTIGVTLPPL